MSASAIQLKSDMQISRQPEAPIQPIQPVNEMTRSSIEEVNTAIARLPSIEVSHYKIFLPHLIEYFQCQVSSFQAGRIAQYLDAWEKITSDSEIQTTVSGEMIPFTSIPVQTTFPFQPAWKGSKNQFIDNEILSLINKEAIIRSAHEHGEFISPIFLCDKCDGSFRMILNLKALNQYVEYNHFKMETIWTAVSMMKPGCYMATIDIKDAYYYVPINKVHQKYLKFKWKGKLYQFTCYPNGLACCTRNFTKLIKPVYCTLREAGHLSVGYIDDSYLQGNDYDQCLENIKGALHWKNKLGSNSRSYPY